jgi:hypothetical protein
MILSAACGGGDGNGPTETSGGDTTLTSSLSDGGPFTAVAVNISVFQGRVFIIGSNGPNESLGIGFELQTGVQYSGTAGGATASYARIGQGSWAAGPNLAASSGTVTLTTATANRIVGSFDFNLVSVGNSVPPTLRFINGRIDISY